MKSFKTIEELESYLEQRKLNHYSVIDIDFIRSSLKEIKSNEPSGSSSRSRERS